MIGFNQVGRGTYWRAFHLARELANRGHIVTLLAMSRDRHLRFRVRSEAGVTIVESPDWLRGALRSGWDPYDVLARISWLRHREYELVHAFESRPVVIWPALHLRRRGIKLILDWCDWFGQGGSVEERPNPLLRAVLRPVETFFEEHFRPYADGTTVINSTLREKAIGRGVPAETIFFLPNGCNVQDIHPIKQSEARQNLGLPADVPMIGYIGAIFRRDAVLMARAFDRIHSQLPSTQLLVIGYCNVDIGSFSRAREAIINTGVVRYDEISAWLSACDIAWLPMCDTGANRGRFPLKINDYMSAGLPLVMTAVGDMADFLRQYPVGLLARDEPVDLAAQALALLQDEEQRRSRGRLARCLAEEELSWAHVARRLETYYVRVLGAS